MKTMQQLGQEALRKNLGLKTKKQIHDYFSSLYKKTQRAVAKTARKASKKGRVIHI